MKNPGKELEKVGEEVSADGVSDYAVHHARTPRLAGTHSTVT